MSSLTAKVPKTTRFFWVTSLVLLLSSDLAAGAELGPSVTFKDSTATSLRAQLDLGCEAAPPGTLTSLKIQGAESAESDGTAFWIDDPSFSPGDLDVTILPELTVEKMCDKLREVLLLVGSFQKRVTLDLVIGWDCAGTPRTYVYPLRFTLICSDPEPSQIHAPSTTDPGPPAPSAPELTDSLQIEGVSADGSGGASVAYEQVFGEVGRQVLRVSVGIRDLSEAVPVGEAITAGEAAAVAHSVIRSRQVSDGTRIETDLKLVPVDLSYGFRLLPPDRPVVPTVYAGAGYVFADADVPDLEGEGLGGLLSPDLDALKGRDESGFTLNAGFSVRFNLRPGGGGKYLYLGARTRWYAKRDADETDEEVFFGLGLPVCHCGGR